MHPIETTERWHSFWDLHVRNKNIPHSFHKSSTDRMKTVINLICQQPSKVNKLNFPSYVDKSITEVHHENPNNSLKDALLV